ncbi:hypothetical protein GLGCALEP_04513 [Pseudomonas sp. MM221]|nr:hypothetical protein DBADOPDK_04399 [Pseudomonas sp. MM223]CAI3807491.1 hypothetical protein GLGCALEP_04513 [Pseudomonas sp. MM221]
MHKLLILSAFTTLAYAGGALADSCPNASDITQKPMGQGFAYTAPGGWSGDNPVADEGDIKSFKFTAVKLNTEVALCDFEGSGPMAGARLALREAKTPDQGDWKDGFCKSGSNNPQDCTFK